MTNSTARSLDVWIDREMSHGCLRGFAARWLADAPNDQAFGQNDQK
jgi:hypothetical protein